MSSNPKHVGPGYWANWHTNSLHTNTREKKAELARNIVTSVDNFPCRDPCRKDAVAYIKKNPLLEAVNNRDEMSLFKWVVDFHNHVNTKIGKRVLTHEEAQKIWTGDEGICFGNCGISEDEIKSENNIIVHNY